MNRAQLMAVKKQRKEDVGINRTITCPVGMTLKDQKDLSTEAQAIKSYSECW